MKARLRYYAKNYIYGQYIMELSIYEVGVSVRYPDGIKYGLFCKDHKTGSYVLIDNHHPKGPHIHINDLELSYEYENDDKLIKDFQRLVFENLGVRL